MTRAEMVATFMEKAAGAAAVAMEVADADALREAIAALLPAAGAVYSPALSELEVAAVQGVTPLVGYEEAQVAVEEVFAGIAETGSIVCASVEGRAVQGSLLPSHHVAILPAEKIYRTLDDFIGSIGTPPTNMAIITGPSRTADIELTLAIGVHGPERVDIFVVNPPVP
ncbi:LUD domain-containing protein [Geomonas sp. RF6]|uniref:LutC/YkgG family protein n=1 Tax=Geomonas sp. RF6 TaxID=2897342 RepID=UPI001E36E23F|nr:LUD domain-containing protein [Geomonas sp. RF6]UFS69003.1 LUD domain-containing protein [Geomonas sp. RF6]